MLTKKEKEERAILAHSIARKVASVEDISYRGAIEILDHVKNILKNNMRSQKTAVSVEVMDKCGAVIKDKTSIEKNKDVVALITGELKKRLKYAEERAAKYDEKGNILKMNIWDNKAMIYREIIETVIFYNLKSNSTKAGGTKWGKIQKSPKSL